MVTLVLPVAGKSSRFGRAIRPKFLLTHPTGDLMLGASLRHTDLDLFDRIVIPYLVEHEERYGAVGAVMRQMGNLGVDYKTTMVPIVGTSSQPHTVTQAIVAAEVSGAMLIKDCDSVFEIEIVPTRPTVYVAELENFPEVRAANKSYVECNARGGILNIVEKRVITNSFCVGGYFFTDASQFAYTYQQCVAMDNPSWQNLYPSHIVYALLGNSETHFYAQRVRTYEDWGTYEDWERMCRTYATIFVDMDGVVCQNSSEYFEPFWFSGQPIFENVNTLRRLHETGRVTIVITTSRPRTLQDLTESQLQEWGVPYHTVIMGLPKAQRILVNDVPVLGGTPSAAAVNVLRNGRDLYTYLQQYVKMEGN